MPEDLELLEKISSQLETISKDQKHIGGFLGETVHAIRKWVTFLGVLIIIAMVLTVINALIS